MAQQIEPDFPSSLACLKNVDALLRCPICFEFLNISMMTKCSHNFCSLCIRRFLSYKLHCPVCNTQMTEQDLRNNRILDDLVVHFQAARDQLLKANFDSPPISPKTVASAVKSRAASEKCQKSSGSILSHFFQKKLQSPPREEAGQHVPLEEMQTAQTHGADVDDLHSGEADSSVVVKEEPVDPEDQPTQSFVSVKEEDTATQSAGFEMAHSSAPSSDVNLPIKVECPVCSVSVAQQFINKHLDMCLASGEKKESLRSPGNTRRPMAKLVYNLLSMQELRRRLKQCHLSVQGSRDQLVRRHQDFIHLHNAQCDSLNPKSVEEIAKQVESNEKKRNQLQRKSKPVMLFTKNQSEKEIEEVHSSYRKQHSSDFSRLIAQVRGRLETKKQACVKQEVAVEREVQEPHTSDQVPESKSFFVVKVEDDEAGEDQSASVIELPSSPSFSDVSISSSISDIFGPETFGNVETTESISVQKRPCSSSGSDEASLGKRRRKT
ncbi:E3 ubiquitin-protein ligase RAD18 isoform X2 [Cololabis saira]|uniref:E3 ubiquitin-protein ligase RAD18 isoform X2 n=1 Tax=Cololabis saira TaxID=129043 RepID=UPI002AD5366C|nr:E3 ubiquitin-protein ligase RAD18 isoform X2 [Cololabis saira]